MATKKVSNKPRAPKAEPAVVEKADVKSGAPRESAVSIAAKPAATRAAEVEANLGGSRPLADFLIEIDWNE